GGGERALRAAWGFQGHPAFGTFLRYPLPESGLDAVRALLLATESRAILGGASALELPDGSAGVVCRALGPSAVKIRAFFTELWLALEALGGGGTEIPRIWAT